MSSTEGHEKLLNDRIFLNLSFSCEVSNGKINTDDTKEKIIETKSCAVD